MAIVSPDGVAHQNTMHVCVVVVVAVGVFVCVLCVCFFALLFVCCFSQWARLPNTMQCFEFYSSKWALCQRMNIVEGGFSQLFCPSKTHTNNMSLGNGFSQRGYPSSMCCLNVVPHSGSPIKPTMLLNMACPNWFACQHTYTCSRTVSPNRFAWQRVSLF